MAFNTGKFQYNSSINVDDSIQVIRLLIFTLLFYINITDLTKATVAMQSLTLRDTRASNNQFKV